MPRELVGELMDDPAIDPAEHAHALRGLARLNAMSRTQAAIYAVLRREARQLERPLTIVDIATGSADLPVALLERARRDGLRFHITACDISPVALEHARERARRAKVELDTRQFDALHDELPQADVLTCSLFLHHLSDAQVRHVLDRMAASARRMVLISDLRRGVWGATLAAIIPRLATRSRVVHVDARRSVRAALTIGEAHALTRGIERGGRWTVVAAFPARMLIRWTPGETSTRS
jgi:2-polyprenyl-3-methyl-5-hydroxy-6-metoxy-1,4-benzoquinol methylase